MCGIFGFASARSDRNAGEVILDGLKELEYRGYDSWGVAVQNQDDLVSEKAVGKIGHHKLGLPKSLIGIGHTRWATHGGVTKENAHPHFDCDQSIAIVHNGIVENYEELQDSLSHQSHSIVSGTDTELIVHLIEEYKRDNDLSGALRQAFVRLEGMNVVVAIERGSNKIIAAKKGSPLVLGVTDNEVYLASDASAVLPHTNNLLFVEDGWLVEIDPGLKSGYRVFEAENGEEVEVLPTKVDWEVGVTSLGDFDHFMLKEIFEQPQILRQLADQAEDKTEDLAGLIQEAYGTFMVGCGTASYAALSGTYLFSRVANRHVNFAVGSEFGYQEQYLRPDSLVIAISQSGETMDIVESIQLAKKYKAKVVAVTNSQGSTLYRIADGSVLLDAGVEKAVCSTKAFTAMVAVLLMLAYRSQHNLSMVSDLIRQSAMDIELMLQPDRLNAIKAIAERIKDREHLFLIGRGLSYPTSLEAALKIKEVSYIHAEGFAGGELKHGVIALIEEGTPCIVFAPNDETEAAIVSNAMELKSRGGYIIGVSPKEHSVFDAWIPVADVGDASIITNVVPAQLLGYYLAIAKGYDPDKPRNLAKSVTVK